MAGLVLYHWSLGRYKCALSYGTFVLSGCLHVPVQRECKHARRQPSDCEATNLPAATNQHFIHGTLQLWDHSKAAGERIHPLKAHHPPPPPPIYAGYLSYCPPSTSRRYRARVFLQSRCGLTLRTMTMSAKGLLWRFTLLGRCLTNV